MGLADGLADGIGMFISIFCCGDACGFAGICIPGIFISIFCCGDACGLGEAAGICIPGIFISIFCCGDACGFGEAAGICIPGIFICIAGDGCAVGVPLLFDEGALLLAGIFIPGIFIPGILLIVCFFVVCRLLVGLRRVLVLFRFAFALDFDMFMPGMFCMSCPCELALLDDESIRPVTMTALTPINLTDVAKLNPLINPPVLLLLFTNKMTMTRTCRHTSAQTI